MLDTQTKKRIDDCRDILVGKLPDPKAQIEQITIGLIYKFMDDMDKEAIELGGNVKFFADYKTPNPEFPNDRKQDKLIEFSKYRWDKLFDSKVTATEMLQLYSEAITGMDKNPNIPPLFRDIFKNAYLPYRDPETLKMFLKTINEFEYSHSEKLGDAFEYLLSVMGSQGDAGQFRTPRHIIDFVTACVNPQKNETVLDPACGTAGFLLSAYKHILNQNTASLSLAGSALSPDDRKKLATNFVGYDISPDMVRLSLANMYLHGFSTPLIHEYDSLSSEERWQETFDVILANPPFMTPKGGIRPHKRFGVQANKAEVLFTDYIAEHLNRNGRAGIVVPNGIVATSQTAYKQLRKMLVQDCLIAVISLPAGVFQPYSGVKTSVLILDKRLAKKSQHILFLKIENDGFDLGAQRREIDKNDLPVALQTLEAYKNHLVTLSEVEGKTFEDLPSLATLVERETIINNKDVGLNAERYFETVKSQTEFELVKIGDAVEINANAIDPLKAFKDEPFVYIDIEAVENGTGKVSYNKILNPKDAPSRARRIVKNGDVIVSTVRPNLKAFAYLENVPKNCLASTGFAVLSENERVSGKYLYYIITQDIIVEQMISMSDKGQYPSITASDLAEIEIPLPPLEIQQQIVAEIESYQKIIDGAKQVVNNYKPTITINPDWEMVDLQHLVNITTGKLNSNESKEDGEYPFFTCSKDTFKIDKWAFDCEALLLAGNNAAAVYDVKHYKGKFNAYQRTYVITIKKEFENRFEYKLLKVQLENHLGHLQNISKGTGTRYLTLGMVQELQISVPPITEQQTIVKAIEEEMQLVHANKRLIELFEQKIKTKIGEVWGVKNLKAV